MPRLTDCQDELIRTLDDHYGSAPVSAPHLARDGTLFERLTWVLLGLVAIPKVAATAFDSLNEAGWLDPVALAVAHPLELDDLMKHDGIAMAVKSWRPLQKLAKWASEQPGTFDLESLADRSTEAIRAEWRTINGIGLAKADALLLSGLRRISYPVDRGTYRILIRHGWLDSTADYDEARTLVERLAAAVAVTDRGNLGEVATVELLIKLGEWFERLSRDFCKPTQAHCQNCPMQPLLPPNGPIEVE